MDDPIDTIDSEAGLRPAKTITIVDIAREAGVSIATVSRYLSGKGPVGDATRTILDTLIRQYSWDKRLLSRGFRKHRTRTIGCIVQQLAQPYFVQSCAAIEAACREAGLTMLLGVATESAELEEHAIQLFIEKQADGLIILGGSANNLEPPARFKAVLSVASEHCPVAFINGYFESPMVCQIRSDEAAGMRALLDLVYQKGHRRIAYVGGQPNQGAAQVRFREFQEWCTAKNISVPAHWVRHAGYSVQAGADAILELLAWKTLPSVLVCANDVLAAGVMKTLYARGFRVPEEMSVIGFDGFELTDYPYPTLTTAAQDFMGLARAAVSSILSCATTAVIPPPLVLPIRIVPGETLANCADGSLEARH